MLNFKKLIITIEGSKEPISAKTAVNCLKYIPEKVSFLVNSEIQNEKCQKLFGVGGDIPIFKDLENVSHEDAFLIGIANPGGVIPDKILNQVELAINKGLNIISGLHNFISEIPYFIELAERRNVKIFDLRKTNFSKVVNEEPLNNDVMRVLTIGNDCSVGKMVVAYELNKFLQNKGIKSKFIATGQTGILLSGDGLPVDALKGDFINGAAYHLCKENEDMEIQIIEGQASIIHPRYSSVSLGLLHGSKPDYMIMVYQPDRKFHHNFNSAQIPSLEGLVKLYERFSLNNSRVIGFAINGKNLSTEELKNEIVRIENEFELPADDIVRNGGTKLGDTLISFLNNKKNIKKL